MEQNITDLQNLGFSLNEAKTYLAIIKIGSSLAGKISKEANLDRSSTYAALKLLVKRGLISTYFENKRTTFVPEDPKKILDYFAEKQEEAKNVIVGLRTLNLSHVKSHTVKLYRGIKGVKSVYTDILNSCNDKTPYFVLGSQGQFGEHLPYYKPIFRKIKSEKNIKSKILTKNLPRKRSRLSEYRVIPKDVDSPSTINIFADKVAIFVWGDTPQAVVLEDPQIANSFRNYFQFMWKNAKKPNPN